LRQPLAVLCALLLGAWGPGVGAVPGDQDQPIEIEADGVELDDGRQVSVYSGNVEVQQGTMRLWADQVTVQHKASRQPARIVAVGRPVRFRQETRSADHKEVKARALRMEYDVDSEEILLIDQAVLTQGKDSFSSDRILYDRNQAVVKAGASAQGRERVRISIDPASR
jgi:lipopolysaccharide export system protein LptA